MLNPIKGNGAISGTSAKTTATIISVLTMLPKSRTVSEIVRLTCPIISKGSTKMGEARLLR